MQGILFVISAPSGTGKTTLCRELMKALPELSYSVSMTTRAPRPGEKEGLDYHFVDRAKFEAMIRQDGFLEYAEVFGHLYGTSKAVVDENVAAGKDVLMDVDVQGAMKIRRDNVGNAAFIFLLPPSMVVLEQRLMQRKTDSEAQIKRRIAMSKQEISQVRHYDYAICNDSLDESIQLLKSIVRAERCRPARNQDALRKLGFET